MTFFFFTGIALPGGKNSYRTCSFTEVSMCKKLTFIHFVCLYRQTGGSGYRNAGVMLLRILRPVSAKVVYMMLVLLFFMIQLLSMHHVAAQNQNLRKEITVKDISEQFHVAVNGTDGLVCFYETPDEALFSNSASWRFIKYDTSFHKVWSRVIPTENRMHYIDHVLNEENLFVLLVYNKSFQIVKVSLHNGTIEVISGKSTRSDISINDFAVINELAFFGGTVPPPQSETCLKSCFASLFFPLLFFQNYMPRRNAFMYHMNMFNNRGKEIPYKTKGYSEATDISADHEALLFEVLVKQNPAREKDFALQQYNAKGVRISSTPLSFRKKGKYLKNGKLYLLNQHETIVAGTYTLDNAGAQGLFFTRVNEGEQHDIKHYPFSSFHHFFDYMDEDKQQKIQEKLDKKREKGKSLKLDYQFLIHEIRKIDSNYVMVAEAYYKDYYTDYQTTYMGGMPVTRPVEVFQGYRFTHAIAVAFDKNGNLRWDISLPMDDYLNEKYEQNVSINIDSGRVTMAHHDDNKLHYKVFDQYETVTDKSRKTLRKLYEDDQVRSSHYAHLKSWYGDYFLAYGLQRIKNTEREDIGKHRKVFYLSKEKPD